MNRIDNLTFTLHDDPPKDAVAATDAGLTAFNDSAVNVDDTRPLACFARAEDGTLVGGAVGRTWGGCCELKLLWVDDAHRGAGVGTRLVREFESRARERGCRTFYIETFSFQAPEFYRALGYETKLAFDGFAPGVEKYIMVRVEDEQRL